MIEREHRYGKLVFDRNAIIRAALRAYVEAIVKFSPVRRLPLSFTACDEPRWTGDLKRGAFYNGDGCGDNEVVAWTEAGVVALAYELGFGPIDYLDLSVDAVTGGPDDVRGALPGLPADLEPALVLATGLLGTGEARRKGDTYVVYGEKLAGVGFWLYDDRVGGTLFSDPTSPGAQPLVMWGMLGGGRLWPTNSCFSGSNTRDAVLECARKEAPIHALIDAVVNRRMRGPTEFTAEELEKLFHSPPDPEQLVGVRRMLQKVGITWPGAPEIPDPPRQRCRDPFLPTPLTTTVHPRGGADQETIVHAALRAYVENILAWLDPLDRHPLAASFAPRWMGDLKRGAFRNRDSDGSYEVMAWSETGLVGLAYELGYGPIEHLELPIDAVKGGSDDVRLALRELPAELEPTLEMAVSLLAEGTFGEKLASVGFWLHGEQAGGSFYDYYVMKGMGRLRAWHSLKGGRLRRWYQGSYVADLGRTKAEPIQDLADALTERALAGPTELTTDELATLLPIAPDPERWREAQRMLQKVGVTWPGSPALAP